MEHNLWMYPWDIADFGLENVVSEVAGWGLSGISLAMGYHAGKLLLATNPSRKVYFPEDGTIYFQPKKALYDGTFVPKVASCVMDAPSLDEVAAECRRQRLRLTAWMVCLHNTRLGRQEPSLCARNAFGDPYPYSLCPANDLARTYIRSLLKDLTTNHHVDAVDLESLNYLGFQHGYHHELNGFAVDPITAFLLSLCFCDACIRQAMSRDIDAIGLRELVRQLIIEGLDGRLPECWAALDLADPATWLRSELGPYLAMRTEVVGSLLAEVRANVKEGVELRFIMRPASQAWQMGVDLQRVATCADTVVLCCYDRSAERIGEWLSQASAVIDGTCRLVAAIRLIEPDTDGLESLTAKHEACVKAGVDGISFYNYALMPAEARHWLQGLELNKYLR